MAAIAQEIVNKEARLLKDQKVGNHVVPAKYHVYVRSIDPADPSRALVSRDSQVFSVALAEMEPAHREVDGTSYDSRTPDAVVRVLENARISRQRLRLHYGQTDPNAPDVGRDWLGEHDVRGTISRSMGPIRVPLLIASSRSRGGPALLDGSIVKITDSTGIVVLYQHPQYHYPKVEVRNEGPSDLRFEVHVAGSVHARFATVEQRARYLKRLGVKVS